MKTPTITALLLATLFTPFAMSAADAPTPTTNSAPPSAAATASTPAATTPPLQDKQIFRLWAGDAPLQHGQDPVKDIPTIQAFVADPAKATGAAIIVFPGGGYSSLSMTNEGTTIAAWLASNGITAFLVKYRLGSNGYRHPAEMDDGQRAVRFVRTYSTAWNIDPNRIGVIGFSAGGHMASTLATHFDQGDPAAADFIDRAGSRPNLQILLYPVITMSDEATVHKGSRNQLLGMNPPDDLKQLLSNELQVTRDTPPAFICQASGDPVVPIGNSDAYVAALEKNNVPVVFLRGPFSNNRHGFGLTNEWNAQCIAWLRTQKF